MGTCVIAADTLNEGYQSVEGGPERASERREERGRRRSVGEIRAKRKVKEVEEKAQAAFQPKNSIIVF